MGNRIFPPKKVIYDGRILLRPVVSDDVPQINLAYQQSLPELKKYMSWAHEASSEEILLERVMQQNSSYFTGNEYELALFDLKTGEFCVYIGFYPSNRLNGRCYEIGYWTSTPQSGKGLATLATRISIALLCEHFDSDRVEITCSRLNPASLRVIEKCNFQLEGVLRNFYPEPTQKMLDDGMIADRSVNMYSLLPEECDELDWYLETLEATQFFPLLGDPYFLSQPPAFG